MLGVAFLFMLRLEGAVIDITGVEKLPNGKTLLTFEDTSLSFLNYIPAVRISLAAGATNQLDASHRITEISSGVFQTIIPDSASSTVFFQVAGFSGPDADADGLSDALETMLGTSTNTFDSDSDGFGDANEILNSSDPLQATSTPNIVKVTFADALSSAKEGDGTLLVQVKLSRSFTGRIRYSVADLSTAVAGSDFATLDGFLDVNGTSAAIPISLLDDLTMEDVELLVIDLLSDPDNGYQAGGASRRSILIYDNDTSWSGVLRSEGSEQSFRLRMLRQGTSVQAALVSTFDTNNTANMQGVSSIPPGVWNLSSATLTTNSFLAISSAIPMGSSTLFGASSLNRVLSLTAEPGPDGANPGTNYLFKPNFIIGTFKDKLTPASAEQQYLTAETSGIFILMEDLPLMPFPDIPSAEPSAAQARVARKTSEAWP